MMSSLSCVSVLLIVCHIGVSGFRFANRNELECGVKTIEFGKAGIAEIDEFPWTALFLYQSMNETNTKTVTRGCEGVLISSQFVVTSAQCLSEGKGILRKIRIGEFNLATQIDCLSRDGAYECVENVNDFDVEVIWIHPGYKKTENKVHNDIALVKLNKQSSRMPICLSAYVEDRNMHYLTSWEKHDLKKKVHIPLKFKAPQPFIDEETCTKYLEDTNLTLTRGQICSSSVKTFDTYIGDIGSALMTSEPISNRYFLQGIKIAEIGESGIGSVYTNVGLYAHWIHANSEI